MRQKAPGSPTKVSKSKEDSFEMLMRQNEALLVERLFDIFSLKQLLIILRETDSIEKFKNELMNNLSVVNK
jgi:hypothetical protein